MEDFERDRKVTDSTAGALPPVEVPTGALSPEALRSVLESFILREGTDYGREETSLAKKVDTLSRQINNGSAHLIFDPNTESINFLTRAEWEKAKR